MDDRQWVGTPFWYVDSHWRRLSLLPSMGW